MLKIGITGGIGSGKTTVCRLFELLGIPVFYTDDAARQLINTDPALVKAIGELFGESVYVNNELDRKAVGQIVFSNPKKLTALNALVHPATIAHSEAWMQGQSTPYSIKESALFFEGGFAETMDLMIGVDAPEDVRIDRVMQRNKLPAEEVKKRIGIQMDNEEKMQRCDYIIMNDDLTALIPQVLDLHQILLAKASH